MSKKRTAKAHRQKRKFPARLTALTFVASSFLGLMVWQGIRTAGHAHIPIALIPLLLAVVAWDVWQIIDWWRS